MGPSYFRYFIECVSTYEIYTNLISKLVINFIVILLPKGVRLQIFTEHFWIYRGLFD